MTFTIATTVDEALTCLGHGARPIAGGTDLVVGARQGKGSLPSSLVAIDRLDELQGIDESADAVLIGAGVTHAQLMAHEMIGRDYSALADAAALVGSPATRNVGTLGGNVMNGSPAMDTGAPLVVLGAEAVLAKIGSTRDLALDLLWVGPGATSAGPDELCIGLRLPARPASSGSAYVRLEYRRAMEIAVVGAAAAVTLDSDGAVSELSVALTAVAPVILAIDVSAVVGRPFDDTAGQAVAQAAAAQAMPISDLRATDNYRRHCVGIMAKRAVQAAARRARGEIIAVPVNRALGIGAA